MDGHSGSGGSASALGSPEEWEPASPIVRRSAISQVRKRRGRTVHAGGVSKRPALNLIFKYAARPVSADDAGRGGGS
jgi:hypothetical protein